MCMFALTILQFIVVYYWPSRTQHTRYHLRLVLFLQGCGREDLLMTLTETSFREKRTMSAFSTTFHLTWRSGRGSVWLFEKRYISSSCDFFLDRSYKDLLYTYRISFQPVFRAGILQSAMPYVQVAQGPVFTVVTVSMCFALFVGLLKHEPRTGKK